MQCKDIPDRPILEFLACRPTLPPFGSVMPANWCFGDGHDVRSAMPPIPKEKLALAKMRQLMRRGLVDGCPCGCRGDFVLTSKGKEFLQQHST